MNENVISEVQELFARAKRTGKWEKCFQQYMRSRHWAQLKREIVLVRPKKCDFCGDRKQVHLLHLQYRNWHDVELDDLIWLCSKHHHLARRFQQRKLLDECGNSTFLYRDLLRLLSENEISQWQRKCQELQGTIDSMDQAIYALEAKNSSIPSANKQLAKMSSYIPRWVTWMAMLSLTLTALATAFVIKNNYCLNPIDYQSQVPLQLNL